MIPLGVIASAHHIGEIPTDGLLLYLNGKDFTNAPPTTTWVDRSAANHDGTASGFAYTPTSGSDNAGSVFFDKNDLINCGSNTFSTITDSLTMAAWVHLENGTASYPRFVCRDGDWGLLSNGNYLRWYGSGLDRNFPIQGNLKDGNWHFVAITYTDQLLSGYVDGASVGQLVKSSGILNTVSKPVTVGNRTNLDRSVKGRIGAVFVYDRVLTPAELSMIMFATQRPVEVEET